MGEKTFDLHESRGTRPRHRREEKCTSNVFFCSVIEPLRSGPLPPRNVPQPARSIEQSDVLRRRTRGDAPGAVLQCSTGNVRACAPDLSPGKRTSLPRTLCKLPPVILPRRGKPRASVRGFDPRSIRHEFNYLRRSDRTEAKELCSRHIQIKMSRSRVPGNAVAGIWQRCARYAVAGKSTSTS